VARRCGGVDSERSLLRFALWIQISLDGGEVDLKANIDEVSLH